ncbi:lasso RiPP family leader peptide-containing protein [Allokutzneria sp. A3M-2-11 16]|nr:lasso RiPP family leader peptide-containing protein [Allokutzneria sp. A3M-2-11 16]MCP3803398.1 lasso RiPP family leader peptide-containing protein [Allokutzneria sp. A3M-2-11 16]
MNEQTTYEPPALSDAGSFDEVTLGGGGRGYDYSRQCWIIC